MSISVRYGTKQVRLLVKPGNVLAELLDQALSEFGIDHQKSWGFYDRSRELPLDIPYRFMGLPQTAVLELKESYKRGDEIGGIMIRLKFIGLPDGKFTEREVSTTEFLDDVIYAVAMQYEFIDALRETKVQWLSKMVSFTALKNASLKSLGIDESTTLRIVLPESFHASKEARPLKRDASEFGHDMSMLIDSNIARNQRTLHNPEVYVSSEHTIASQILKHDSDDDSNYELTVEQARRYQRLLSDRAGNGGGPLLTQRLRDKQVAQKTLKLNQKIQQCIIRVRFPDRTYVEIAFQPQDHISLVYDTLCELLLDPNSNFKLALSHPHITLARTQKTLMEDLGFGSKTLLLFESEAPGPYLKPEILTNAKSVNELVDVRHYTMDYSKTEESNQSIPAASNSETKKVMTKVPKWLKLSKK